MPYHFKAGETVRDGINRIVAEEADSAVKQLSNGEPGKRDEKIHEARKSLKKIRALLRLIQPEISRSFYRRENGRIRDVGRQLSELRDAGAMLELLEDLATRYKTELQPSAVASLRRGLQKTKAEMESPEHVDDVSQQTIKALGQARKQLSNLPVDSDGFEALAPGFRRYYRLGREAMSEAKRQGTPEAYHEWRKRAKDHWYHLHLFEKLANEDLKTHEENLKTIESSLGDDHNLFVLKQRLTEDPDRYGKKKDVDHWLKLADRRSLELRKQALEIGREVYGGKPRRLEQQAAALWEAWKMRNEEPKTAPAPRKSSNSAKIVQSRTARRAS